MKFLPVLFLSVLTSNIESYCQGKADSIAVVKLLTLDYQTMENFDITGHINNCTSDYLLIENGEVWDLARESRYFRENKHRKISRKNTFNFKKVYTTGGYAYAVYELQSDIFENGKMTRYLWTESAVFKKANGKWKIALIHSTKIR